MVYHGSSVGIGASRGSFEDLPAEVLEAVRTFERKRVGQKTVIAVTGVSGMSLGFPLAQKLGLDIVVLRKPGEDCHGTPGRLVGVSTKGRKVVFVDDFVSGGATKRRVLAAIKADGGKVVAQYMSRDGWSAVR